MQSQQSRTTATPEFYAFLVECGVLYWVAAPTYKSAIEAWFAAIEAEGLTDDDLSYVNVEMASLERSKASSIHLDGGGPNGEESVTVWQLTKLAEKDNKPSVIGCSEW